MRCLVVAPEPFFSPRGTPLSVYYRTLITAELGVRVDLLTYGQGQDVDIPGVQIIRIPSFRWLGPVKVGPSYLKAFLDVFLLLWSIALMLRHRYDLVHAHEEAIFFCRLLKPVFRFRLVYDMHSILSQQLTNFAFTRSRLLIGMFSRLEDGCLAAADAVITISPELADYALGRVADPEHHFLIENSLFDEVRIVGEPDGDGGGTAGSERTAAAESKAGAKNKASAESKAAAESAADGGGMADADVTADGDNTARADARSLLEVVPENHELVLYAGTFEPYQGLDLLLKAFRKVIDRRPETFLLMVGGRPDQVETHRRLAVRLGLDGKSSLPGAVPPNVARRLTRKADILTSPRRTGSNTPLKIYEQLASGVPLVATRILAHTQVLDDEVCFLADPDADSLAQALLRALEDAPEAARVAANARKLYEERYARSIYVEKMRRLLEAVS